MSTAAPPSAQPSVRRSAHFQRVRDFWERVSEGRDVDDLWSQFVADARSSYGFYGKDVDWDEVHKLPAWKRPLRVGWQLFWAMMMKLAPARRVLLLVSLVLLVVSGIQIHSEQFNTDIRFESIAALLLLLLLSLELADKVVMKRDLEIAREIQSWLVPSEPPAVPGAEIAFCTRPQNSVAGDYYDAFYPEDDGADGGKLMVIIADVVGKSVPAALLMATLQSSLRTLASERLPLAQLAERLNRNACAHSLDGQRFTTAVIAEYDPAGCHLEYINAGHNAPVLQRANGATERLHSCSLPFGIRPNAVFLAAAVDLHPGDTLVLFTDGVVEAFNAGGEEFSDTRWVNAIRSLPNVPAQETLRRLMKRVEEFVGKTRQSDDITCLVLQIK